jgi:hypothetical protein
VEQFRKLVVSIGRFRGEYVWKRNVEEGIEAGQLNVFFKKYI